MPASPRWPGSCGVRVRPVHSWKCPRRATGEVSPARACTYVPEGCTDVPISLDFARKMRMADSDRHPQTNGRDRRDAILRAALQLIGRQGMHAVTHRDVAAEA